MLLYATLRIELQGALEAKDAAKGKLIIAIWHNKLLLAPLLRRALPKTALAAVVSNSSDGKLLAAFVATFRNTTSIFVAHNKRHKALLQMIDAQDKGIALLITPDGPRGPCHQVKPGIFYTQQKTGATLLAMSWHASSYWQLNSWDKMQIPKPFSKVCITFSTATDATLEKMLSL